MGGTFLLAAVKSFDANIAISTNFVLNAKKLESFVFIWTTLGFFSQRQPWWFVTETHFSFMRIVIEQCMKQVSPTFCNVMYIYACAHFAFNAHSVQSMNTIWTCVNRKSWTAVPAASCGLRYVVVLHVKRLTCHINALTATVFFKFTKTNNDFIHCYSFWLGRKQGFL